MFSQDEWPTDEGEAVDAPPSDTPSPEALLHTDTPLLRTTRSEAAPLSQKAKLKAAGHARRKRRKKEEHRVDPKLLERYPKDTPQLAVDMSFKNAKVTSTGFVGLNDIEESHREYMLEELTGKESIFKFTLQRWNGEDTRLIVDKNGVVCAVLAGHPNTEDWLGIHQQAAAALEQAHICSSVKHGVHRRGAFATFRNGISHGGGQRHPMNLTNNKGDQEIISELNNMDCFIRMANFASAVMARQAPALHHHYATTLQKLEEKDPSLCRAFPDSVFAAATYNLGPETVCFVHKDPGNYACGVCAVTPVGLFDAEKGGHLVLWECRVVVEFPAGSTILLPSAVIAHLNTSIAPTETRYSFTQYSAGALFQWVSNGFQRSVDFFGSLTPEELAQEDKRKERRWKESLLLLPRVEVKTEVIDSGGGGPCMGTEL